jgi:ABC-type transport system involved in cytochrome bd biosynthesis fused ATPase/permease subunit
MIEFKVKNKDKRSSHEYSFIIEPFLRSAKANRYVIVIRAMYSHKITFTMLKNISLFLILSSIFLFSCGETKPKGAGLQKEKEQVYKEVMAVHDEMMMMKKIRGAQSKLKKMMESDSINLEKYQTAYDQLQVADDAMMDWMKQFKNPPQNTEAKEAIEYLNDQKVKVQKMKEVMVENMDKAKQVVDFQ